MHYYTTETTNRKIMLSKDSAKDYEEFSPDMPSTKYPSEIENVGDNINLYDKDNPNVLDTPLDTNGLGANVLNTYKTIWIPCQSNEIYTISKKYDETKNRFAVAYSSIEPDYNMQVEGYISNQNTNVVTITTNENAKYLIAYVWITGGSITYEEMLDSIKIEKEKKATSLSPYKCGNIDITVCNKNLLKQELELYDGNYDNSGNYSSNKDKRINDYIFLKKGNYIISANNNNWINLLVYDIDKNLLSITNSSVDKKLSFSLEEDGYIRFGFNPVVASLKDMQIEKRNNKHRDNSTRTTTNNISTCTRSKTI